MARTSRRSTALALSDAERALRRKTHETIRRVTLDLDPRVHLNTAVSAQMELVNELYAFLKARALRAVARPTSRLSPDRSPPSAPSNARRSQSSRSPSKPSS